MRTRIVIAALLLATAALCRDALAAWPSNPATNVPVCTAAGDQLWPALVPDGSGGAIMAWTDARGGNNDVYAQHISSTGQALWWYNGEVVSDGAYAQEHPLLVSDGAGGAIIAWRDCRGSINGSTGDVYVQRLSSSGDALWTAGGVPVCVSDGQTYLDAMMPDDAGGAFIVFEDQRNILYGSTSVCVQRVSSAGTVLWTTNGVQVSGTPSSGSATIAPDGAGGAIVAWISSAYSLDVLARRFNSSGTMLWASPVTICGAAGDQIHPAIVADGAGGAIVAWEDHRTDVYGDIYAQRVSSAGAVQWTGDGVALTTISGSQTYPRLVPSSANGAIVVWGDGRAPSTVYGQRLAGDGSAQWTAGGMALDSPGTSQYSPCIASDGANGALLAWVEQSPNPPDVRAQHIDANGADLWRARGVPVSTASGDQVSPVFTTDGAGGMIAVWSDYRNSSTTTDLYAQHVDPWGWLNPAPAIASAADVPADQGGHVTVAWSASPNDTGSTNPIADYRVWRRAPSSATWEAVGTLAATRLAGYSLSVPTTVDSTSGGNPLTTFRVEARGTLAGSWYSDSLKGYSVDNLAPPAPAPFTGQYAAGTTRLHWPVCPNADFLQFRLHRGDDSTFVPGPANLVTGLADTGYVDVHGSPAFYKLCAVDVHGNVGAYASVQFTQPVDVPGALPRELALSAPAPNPLRAGTTLRLALPRDARVTLAVLDAQGRRVRTLLAGAQPAGEHAIAWDGRDDGGRRMADGIYLVRLECEGRVITRRIAALR